ncbi:major facilitator superfamily domain-containing protein [Chaetomium sp. MPI-CAGE-AT-0009]|nr:major facilitator superfamily domain-containing protein [Chaetomium sp. MPI-CAGE-AT-0009]
MARAIPLLAALVFLLGLSDNVTAAARIRVLEFAVCFEYFAPREPGTPGLAGPIQEGECKIPAVQQQLATLRAWLGALEALPTLLVGLPLGYYADKVGRRPVLIWSTIGILLNLGSMAAICYFRQLFPANDVLASPIFLLFGGGKFVFLAMIMSMTIDISPENERTNNVFMVFIPDLITGIIGPPAGALLLSWNLWATLISGTVALLLTFPVMMLLPAETPEKGKLGPIAPDADPGEYEPLWRGDIEHAPATAAPHRTLWTAALFDQLAEVVHGVLSFPLNRNVALALASVVVSTSSQIDDILLPYLSITYNWSLAQASNVLPLLAVLNLGFAFALPRLANTIRTASGLTSWEVDWALTVGSVLPLVVGAVVIGLWQTMEGTITGLIIQTAGYGNRLFLLSLLPSMVPADTRAQLYMLLSLVDTIGGFARSTLMEPLFGLSLGLGGRGTGLPFIVSGFCQLAAGALLSLMRPQSDVVHIS